MDGLKAIKYERGNLQVLDQLKLPHDFQYVQVNTCEDAFAVIRSMKVRGAPAIAIVAALALAVELSHENSNIEDGDERRYIEDRLDYLQRSRPTAVDLSNAIRLLKAVVEARQMANRLDSSGDHMNPIKLAYIQAAEKIFADDLDTNIAIGKHGAEYLRRLEDPHQALNGSDPSRFFTQGQPAQTYRKISVLTHCNTGSLATSGHGTALGIIRSLHSLDYLNHAYCTETRPYNQGSRLTAFELVYEKIPSTLICDSMAAALFSRYKTEKNIKAVIVGADRVARNGDTANKIGTYALAVLAKYHGIKFIVAAPTTSIDLLTLTGGEIEIEDRAGHEMTQTTGPVLVGETPDLSQTVRIAVAHQEIDVWNPAFDVTPHELIDAIITEKGEVVKSAKGEFNFQHIMPERWAEACSATNGHGNGHASSDDNNSSHASSDEDPFALQALSTEITLAQSAANGVNIEHV